MPKKIIIEQGVHWKAGETEIQISSKVYEKQQTHFIL